MGATTAIFSVVDAVLLKPLPFRDPGRLLAIWEKNYDQRKFRLFVAAGNFQEWQRQSRSFESMAAIQDLRINLTGGPNGRIEAEELRAERVSASLFPLLGVEAAVGRTFRDEEDMPGRADCVLLSHSLWETRFGADPSIGGKAIRLQDRGYTIVGVLPAGFAVLDPGIDVWMPLALNTSSPRASAARNLMIVARLRPGAEMEQARNEMETIGDRLERANPALNTGWRPSLFPLQNELVGTVQQALLVLSGAVGALLLMACVNVANLLLARATARRREFAIRSALGASRGRIVAQLLSENVVLALAGGALGLLVARGAMALAAHFGPASIPRLAEARLDARLFLFAFGVSALTGVLFGMVPAMQVWAGSHAALREGGRGGTMGRSSRVLRNALAVAEVALAVLVLIGAGLLIRSFIRLRSADPGFQPANLLTFRVPLIPARGSSPAQRMATFQAISDRLAALPGVRAVGAVNSLPLTGLGLGDTFTIQGRAASPGQGPIALVRAVSTNYIRVMGIPLKEGRDFTAADTTGARRAVVVNETLARRFRPSSAIGGRLALANLGGVEIVGVVGDVKADRLEAEEWPTLYYPYAYATMTMVVRTSAPPLSLVSAVEHELHQFDPDQPIADVRPMEMVMDQATAGARFNMVLLTLFAEIAFLLAAVGIYGVIAYDVSRRTNEIGIRMAMGALPGDVLQLIMKQGARLAACGIAAGLVMALALTRVMETMLYGVKTTDGYTFAGISVLLGAVALLASYLPARRAMALDPVTALRHE